MSRLVPFPAQQLRVNERVPLALHNAAGRLLLAAGQMVDGAARLQELLAQPLFAIEQEAQDWQRRVNLAMDQKLRQGAALKDVASARPDAPPREAAKTTELPLAEQWLEITLHLDSALREAKDGGADWRAKLLGVHARSRLLATRRLDATLYHLVYAASHSAEKYSSHHALLCSVICEQVAPMLDIAGPTLDSLGRAALTMNVAMLRLQDQMALTQLQPSDAQRAEIDGHAHNGARLLQDGGLADPLACAVVALHHDASEQHKAWGQLTLAQQLARLLRRVDIFAAKISRRASRAPMSPVQAAREACLGPAGVPDEVGSALLKAVGLYPPGSFVELASGELGIVVARGRRANLPYVASLVSANGSPLGEPALRDTIDRRYAVRSAVPPAQVRVRPPHERLMALR
jgi:HD-GYP domain-containing protein (c-di-GMP phosphodiesterase class II)